ncbi:MAG: ATPase domain-containing protein [Candidatus Margulisiibacteriota bacterium]
MERVDTGIGGLDNIIEGGLPAGKAYLLSGEPGTGKTLFTLQYLMHGAQKGENGIYVSIDEKPEHVISDAENMGWDIKKYLDSGLIQILDVSAYFSNARMGKKEELAVDQVVENLAEHAKSVQVKRLVIDPIAPLIFSHEGRQEIAEYMRTLIFSIEDSLNCTSLLTSHVPVGTQQFSQYGVEEFLVSGVIVLRIVKSEKRYLRSLFVRKLRGTQTDLTEYSFEITRGRGLILRQPI